MPHSSSPKTAELKWRTSAAKDPHAYEAYRESIRDLYDITDINGVEAKFEAGAHVYAFDDLVICHGYAHGHQFERTAQGIRRSGLDNISIILDFVGMVGDRDGQTVNAGPGGLHFVDYARPLKTLPHAVDAISLALPRARVADWMLRSEMNGFVLSPDSAGARLITAHLKSIMALGSGLSAEEGVAAIEAALLMIGRSIGQSLRMEEAQTQTSYRTVRQMATQYIDQNLMVPNLTPDALALEIGISRATLYRAFDTEGGVHSHIQGRRLDRAYWVLGRRTGRSPTIAEVAYGHGFISAPHFNRAFRARFGMSPGEVTPRLRASAPTNETLIFDAPRIDISTDWLRGHLVRRSGKTLKQPDPHEIDVLS